jgi:hypothetical protein
LRLERTPIENNNKTLDSGEEIFDADRACGGCAAHRRP